MWRAQRSATASKPVVQLHRLREVLALVGFTRFEAVTPDIDGEYDTDVERAAARARAEVVPGRREPRRRDLRSASAGRRDELAARPAVERAARAAGRGHRALGEERKSKRPFPGGPYVLLHTLSHLLMQSLSMRCGYPASSIRERIYADVEGERYGLLLYTASPDAEGTLGGLVQQARQIEAHLRRRAARGGAVLERPRLRPARSRQGHGGALASRRRLPRLLADRRDVVRDAQRLPRPGARRADARRSRTRRTSPRSRDRPAARTSESHPQPPFAIVIGGAPRTPLHLRCRALECAFQRTWPPTRLAP